MINNIPKQIILRMTGGVIVVFLLAQVMFAAEPMVKLPPLPSKAEMEKYEDNEEMYASLLLEYYTTAATLDAQLKYWEIKPIVTVPIPTLEEITSQEAKTLKKFHNVAFKLQLQIESLPEEQVHAELYNVQKRLQEEKRKSIELGIKNYELDLKSQKADIYSGRVYEIAKFCDSIKKALDSISYKYYMLQYTSSSTMARVLDDTFIPSLMLSNSVFIPSISAGGIQTDISYGAKAELNMNSLAEYGKYFDIWFAYLMPQIKTNPDPENMNSAWREWNSNIYSIGFNLNLPGIIELKPVKAGIKIGVGHYWGSASSPNISLPEAKYKGQTLNLELNFSKFTTISPASLYFNFGVLFPTRDMIFGDPGQDVNIGKATISTFSLGLRFNIL
ncbi:MAG: hypothetical protein HYZ54_11705 [Ignavibacteriae bacterium]|nr:hypothetical protein [Ignavibacteriota bacterium]